VVLQPRIGRHVGLFDDIARIAQMHAMPVIGIALADTRQVGSGTLGAPQEGVVIPGLSGQRIWAVALHFGAEHADLLRMAAHTAFTYVDIAADQIERLVGLYPRRSLGGGVLKEQRNDLGQAGKRDDGNAQDDQQAHIGFNHLVRETGTFLGHLWTPYAVAEAGPIKAGSRASGLYSGTAGLTLGCPFTVFQVFHAMMHMPVRNSSPPIRRMA